MSVARLVLWNLADADATVEELRERLRDELHDADGLVFQAWLSDETGERWGAFSIWESADAAQAPLPPPLRELIGKDPEIVELFEVEAGR